MPAPSPPPAWCPATPPTTSGSSCTAGCRASPGARCRSTTRCTPRRCRAIVATRASPTCSTATTGCTSIREAATDVYTRQCSLRVSATDLAVMGATLADGGVNPITGERVVSAGHVRAGAGRAGHRRAVRAIRRLAVRHRPARQERRQWRHRHHRARARAPSARSRRRSTWRATACAGSASHAFLSERLGLNLFASQPEEAERALTRVRAGRCTQILPRNSCSRCGVVGGPAVGRGHRSPSGHERDAVVVPEAGLGAEAGGEVGHALGPGDEREPRRPRRDVVALRVLDPLGLATTSSPCSRT